MYYKIRSMNTRNGRVNLVVAASNVRNSDGSLEWFRTEYEKEIPFSKALEDFFVDVLEGNLQFYPSSKNRAAILALEMRNLIRKNCPDITFERDFTYRRDFGRDSRRCCIRMYGIPKMISKETRKDEAVRELVRINEAARIAYREEQNELTKRHIVLISSALRINDKYCEFWGNPLDPAYPNKHMIGLLDAYDGHGRYDNSKATLKSFPIIKN